MQAEGDTEMEIDRSTTWTRARNDKHGNFTNAVEKTVTKIVSWSCMFDMLKIRF